MRISTSALVLVATVAAGQMADADMLDSTPPGSTVGGVLVVPADPSAGPDAALFPAPQPVHVGTATIGGRDTTYSDIGGVVFSSDGSPVRTVGETPFVDGRNGPVACGRIGEAVSCRKGR